MDVSALAGLGLAVAALVVSLLIEGGNFASLINPSALVLILGGTLGATIMSFPKRQAMSLVGWIVRALRGGEPNLREIVEALVSFAEMARREGLMSLEGKLSAVGNPLVAHGLELVASALDIDQIRSIHVQTGCRQIRERRRGFGQSPAGRSILGRGPTWWARGRGTGRDARGGP